MKEMLANIILDLALQGKREPEDICDHALRRLPPVVSYQARERAINLSAQERANP